jgi:hypothetical protein
MPVDALHQGDQHIYYDVAMLRDAVCPNNPTFDVLASLDSAIFNILQTCFIFLHLLPFN